MQLSTKTLYSGLSVLFLVTLFSSTPLTRVDSQRFSWEIYNSKEREYMTLKGPNPRIKSRIVAYWHATIFSEMEIAANYPNFGHEVNVFIRSKVTHVPMQLRMGAEYDEAYISGFAIDLERGGKIVSVNSGNNDYSGVMTITKFDKDKRLISGEFEFESKAYKTYKLRGQFDDIKIPN